MAALRGGAQVGSAHPAVVQVEIVRAMEVRQRWDTLAGQVQRQQLGRVAAVVGQVRQVQMPPQILAEMVAQELPAVFQERKSITAGAVVAQYLRMLKLLVLVVQELAGMAACRRMPEQTVLRLLLGQLILEVAAGVAVEATVEPLAALVS